MRYLCAVPFFSAFYILYVIFINFVLLRSKERIIEYDATYDLLIEPRSCKPKTRDKLVLFYTPLSEGKDDTILLFHSTTSLIQMTKTVEHCYAIQHSTKNTLVNSMSNMCLSLAAVAVASQTGNLNSRMSPIVTSYSRQCWKTIER